MSTWSGRPPRGWGANGTVRSVENEYTAKAEQAAADAGLSGDSMDTVRQTLRFLLESADAA